MSKDKKLKDVVLVTKGRKLKITERIVVLSDKHPVNPGGTSVETTYEYLD